MATNYICKKCSFTSENYYTMQKHLNKKKQCLKNLESYNYSDDQLLVLSLLPVDNNIEKNIEYLKNSNIIYKNKDKLLSTIEYINKNKIKKCMTCNIEFNKINDLKYHYITSCFYNELTKQHNQNNIISMQNSQLSINSNNITNNITNNIYIEINNPIPFDEDWDISKIADDKKTSLLISKIMYTGLLEEILKNEINLNVIIDKNNESGLVYKNDIDQYIQMKSKDIVDNTMNKLHKHLLEINSNNNVSCLEECLKESKKIIIQKYNDYEKNCTTQKIVHDFISNMYENKKENAIKLSKNINNNIQKEGF